MRNKVKQHVYVYLSSSAWTLNHNSEPLPIQSLKNYASKWTVRKEEYTFQKKKTFWFIVENEPIITPKSLLWLIKGQTDIFGVQQSDFCTSTPYAAV